MDNLKLIKHLFTLNYMNVYKDIGTPLKRQFTSRQHVYNYLTRENIPLQDFISICDYLHINITLTIDGRIYKLTEDGLQGTDDITLNILKRLK